MFQLMNCKSLRMVVSEFYSIWTEWTSMQHHHFHSKPTVSKRKCTLPWKHEVPFLNWYDKALLIILSFFFLQSMKNVHSDFSFHKSNETSVTRISSGEKEQRKKILGNIWSSCMWHTFTQGSNWIQVRELSRRDQDNSTCLVLLVFAQMSILSRVGGGSCIPHLLRARKVFVTFLCRYFLSHDLN